MDFLMKSRSKNFQILYVFNQVPKNKIPNMQVFPPTAKQATL